jgi:hypothetical protein
MTSSSLDIIHTEIAMMSRLRVAVRNSYLRNHQPFFPRKITDAAKKAPEKKKLTIYMMEALDRPDLSHTLY